MPNEPDQTYIEEVQEPNKVMPPNENIGLVALRVEESGGKIPFTLLGDVPLYLSHSSEIKISVSGSLNVHTLAHVVSCPIAPSTDQLSSSNFFPFNPRSRA